VSNGDVDSKIKKQELNGYAFNCGTGRFEVRNPKANVLAGKKPDRSFDEPLGDNRWMQKKGIIGERQEKCTLEALTYTTSYGGGYKGGLMTGEQALAIQKDRAPFGSVGERWVEQTRDGGHLGPGVYYNKPTLIKETNNVRYH
jgi:hypothetical protein